MDKNNRKLKIKANNTSATWQHAAHTTNQNTHLLTAPKKLNMSHTKEPTFRENGGLGKKKSGERAKSRKG